MSVLVAGALAAERMTLASIGRELAALQDTPGAGVGAGTLAGAAKHAIKRAWRFISNPRVEPVNAMPLLMNRLWRRKLKWHGKKPDRRPLLVSLDWTKLRGLSTLMAAVVVQGRALPFCWHSYSDTTMPKSQNALEYAMLQRLKAALPPQVQIVILADRGFGRAQLAVECQQMGMDYLVRVSADVIVKTQRWQGNLKQYPMRRGLCQGWKDVEYRSDGLVRTNLVLRWKKDLPPKKDQPWYLITSLPLQRRGDALRYSDLYALRFDIEELFRDAKNEHLGWSLAKTRIKRAERLDRLILILALAYLLLVALGLWCRQHQPARLWASNNRPHELSAYAIGRVMLNRLAIDLARLIALLLRSLATSRGNWG